MAAELLLDTGPFVAMIDRSETRHRECVRTLERWQGTILTTEAVLTEALYLLGPSWRPQNSCLEFVFSGAVVLVPASLDSLRRAAALMEKYADLPMDYADATLVALAEEVGTDQVFTLDQRGFSVFRLHGSKPFRLLPGGP